MNPFSRVAVAAIAVIVIVGGGIYLFSPNGQVAGPSPAAPTSAPAAPSPTPIPSAAPPATLTVDQSKEAGYTIAIPSTWRSRTYPNGIFISAAAPITTGAMWFSAATGGEHVIDVGVAYGGSPYDIRGQTVDELLASVDSVYRAQTSSEGSNEHEVTIDGEPAWVTEHEVAAPPTLWIDAVVIHGDRAYNLSLDAPVENAAELRAAFDEVMASIRWTD